MYFFNIANRKKGLEAVIQSGCVKLLKSVCMLWNLFPKEKPFHWELTHSAMVIAASSGKYEMLVEMCETHGHVMTADILKACKNIKGGKLVHLRDLVLESVLDSVTLVYV